MANTHEAELVRSARALARLQTQRRKLRRQLRAVEVDIRAERKTLKALASLTRDPDVIPSRLFGDGVGRKVARVERVPCPTCNDTYTPLAAESCPTCGNTGLVPLDLDPVGDDVVPTLTVTPDAEAALATIADGLARKRRGGRS